MRVVIPDGGDDGDAGDFLFGLYGELEADSQNRQQQPMREAEHLGGLRGGSVDCGTTILPQSGLILHSTNGLTQRREKREAAKSQLAQLALSLRPLRFFAPLRFFLQWS